MTRNDLKALGPIGLLGFGLLCFSVSLALSAVRPMWATHDRLQVGVDALAQTNDQFRQSLPVTVAEPALIDGLHGLPVIGEAHVRLQAIQAIAVEEGLGLERANYGVGRDDPSGEMHYTVTLPLRAPYGVVRRFIERVLDSATNIALDSLVMRRQRSTDPLVEAELRLIVRFAAP